MNALHSQPFGIRTLLPIVRSKTGDLVAGSLVTLSSPITTGADLTLLRAEHFTRYFHSLVAGGTTESKALDKAIIAIPKCYEAWRQSITKL